MNITPRQYRKQRKDLLELYPDAKFQTVIESPGQSPVIVPSLDLPTGIAGGLHKVTVSVMQKGSKDAAVVLAGTLSIDEPAEQQTADEPAGQTAQPLTLDAIVQQIRAVEQYRYTQMSEADKVLANAQFESIRLYHEAKDKQYQDWIERLQRETETVRAQEAERRKIDLDWQEKLHQQQIEIERLRLQQPIETPAMSQEMQQALSQLVSIATQIGAAIAAKKFGLSHDAPVPPPFKESTP